MFDLLLSVYVNKVYTNLKSRANGKIDIPIAFIFIKQSVITHLLYLLAFIFFKQSVITHQLCYVFLIMVFFSKLPAMYHIYNYQKLKKKNTH